MSLPLLSSVLRVRVRHVGLGLGLVLQGCGQESATASLRALDTAGEVSVLCLARDESGAFTRGAERSACPDLTTGVDTPASRHLHALVTQPSSGEVALVDLDVNPVDAVVDFEPTQPGYSFMPVGAEPIAIASTPGGVASFVAVREPGREGIFGLPSSCINERPDTAPVRDIRTWPACRLPAAPGPMVMLDDPAIDHDGDSTTAPLVRDRCDGEYVEPEALIGQAAAATRAQCPADLASETHPSGRRKLAVTLPSLSEIWVIDAQELLDRDPGSFDACTFEQRLVLGAEVSGAEQRLPADLIPSSPSCGPVGLDYGPVPDTFQPRPADLALDDEQRLYIADTEAPLVHVLDARNPCALAPLPSLEPRSYLDPGAVITTRRVAVSPLTPLGKRFVYAVDNSLTRTAGSLMVFDVSPGSTERTPVVRERSALNPAEPPDRIALSRDVADVEFLFQDFPEPTNAAAVEGIACDPHPSVPLESPAAQYRASPDLGSGAGPLKLRGTFAFAALHSGQLAVIDVEDLDDHCRRPTSANPAPTEDIFGCKNDDPTLQEGYSVSGRTTVSNELSCNVVAPHRTRGRRYFANIPGGLRSAGLVAFPTLTLDTGRSVTSDLSDEGRNQPKMLAARHGDAPEELFVGPLVYRTSEEATFRLEMDPDRADRNSLLLSYEEPRAYIPSEELTATYEGIVRQSGQALLSVDDDSGLGVINEGLNASLCSAGVQDVDIATVVAGELGLTSGAAQASFARRHADYAQLTGAFLEEDEPYWADPQGGAQCGAAFFQDPGDTTARLVGRPFCEEFFGPPELPSRWRDLRIVEASEDRLLVEPRDPREISPNRRRQLMDFASCCFPGLTSYQVRAGHQWVVRGSGTGVPHRVTTDPTSLRCVRDCSPLVQRQQSRVFELSCSEDCPVDEQGRPPIGYARADEDFACVVSNVDGGIAPGEPGAECVFQSLTTRFAMYRGQRPSTRDMRFRWQLTDGFNPFAIPLTSAERSTERSTPRSLLLLPETSRFVISDGSLRGLILVSARNTRVTSYIF